MAVPTDAIVKATNAKTNADTKISRDVKNIRIITDQVINYPIDTTDDLVFNCLGKTLTILAPIRTTGDILLCSKDTRLLSSLEGHDCLYFANSMAQGYINCTGSLYLHLGPNPDIEKAIKEFNKTRFKYRDERTKTFPIYTLQAPTDAQIKLILDRDGLILSSIAADAVAVASAAAANPVPVAGQPIRFHMDPKHLKSQAKGGIRELLGLDRVLLKDLTPEKIDGLQKRFANLTFEADPTQPGDQTRKIVTFATGDRAAIVAFVDPDDNSNNNTTAENSTAAAATASAEGAPNPKSISTPVASVSIPVFQSAAVIENRPIYTIQKPTKAQIELIQTLGGSILPPPIASASAISKTSELIHFHMDPKQLTLGNRGLLGLNRTRLKYLTPAQIEILQKKFPYLTLETDLSQPGDNTRKIATFAKEDRKIIEEFVSATINNNKATAGSPAASITYTTSAGSAAASPTLPVAKPADMLDRKSASDITKSNTSDPKNSTAIAAAPAATATTPVSQATATTEMDAKLLAEVNIAACVISITESQVKNLGKKEKWEIQIAEIIHGFSTEKNPPANQSLEDKMARIVRILELTNSPQKFTPAEILALRVLSKAAILKPANPTQKNEAKPQAGTPILPLQAAQQATAAAGATPATAAAQATPATKTTYTYTTYC